jgi:hypothetical protein
MELELLLSLFFKEEIETQKLCKDGRDASKCFNAKGKGPTEKARLRTYREEQGPEEMEREDM